MRLRPLLASLAAVFLSPAAGGAAPGEGTTAPTFGLYAINTDVAMDRVGSSVVQLEEFVGVRPSVPARAVVLAFFESTDEGALSELQALARLQKRHGAHVQVLAICADRDLAEISRLTLVKALPYPVLRDRFRVVSDRYGAPRGRIEYVLLGGEGQVVASWQGTVAQHEAQIAARAGG